ncbi:CgeB family protein [Sorangium sp. So ce117]|uniref:CgeB family protein n=1 Tax=Sorangium sp. So ce117 TaxID=3133277 RepID=UPI003F63711E
MRLVIFGLTISSSWGNGHATLWRGVVSALGRAGHSVTFFERDVPYYAAHRDLTALSHGNTLRLYTSFEDVLPEARRAVREADAAMVTSYCPDGGPATDVVLESGALKVFYDLDTPVTLDRIQAGLPVGYIGPRGLVDFDCVLSYTGGAALDRLQAQLGARRVFPLYGSADPAVHRPVPPRDGFRGDLSYLGTYAADRQAALSRLFLEAARRLPEKRFVIGGSLYPEDFPWAQNGDNVHYLRHVAPPDHPAFYCSSRMTLNVTRGAMAAMGYCPSGRLFEAAACGTPILSDAWEGLDRFFTPGREILVAATTDDAVAALSLPEGELAAIASAARERVLAEHSAARRAAELVAILESVSAH